MLMKFSQMVDYVRMLIPLIYFQGQKISCVSGYVALSEEGKFSTPQIQAKNYFSCLKHFMVFTPNYSKEAWKCKSK